MERLFNLDFQLLHDSVLTLISVFVLVLCGSFFFFNPARKFIEGRRKRIADDIDAAKNDKEKAESLKNEYEEKLKNVDAEAETILSKARQRALAREDKIVADARDEAQKIIENANREAELEKKKDRIEFTWEQISDNSFSVVTETLPPGEYAVAIRPSALSPYDFSCVFGFTVEAPAE